MKNSNLLKLLAFLPVLALFSGCTSDVFVGGDCFDGCNGNGVFTIQGAIDAARPGDTIFIRRGIYSPSTNGEQFPIFMQPGVSLQGEDPNNTIIDAQGSAHVLDLFNYNNGTISNFTLTNGVDSEGGGVRAENSSGILNNLIIVNNSVSDAGTGIYVKNSTGLIMDNLIISGNFKTSGSGNDPSQVELDDSGVSFNNNVVAFGDSDGIRLNFGSDGTFENNIFYQNGSNTFGAGFADTDPAVPASATIGYNICFGNAEGDFYLNGTDLTAQQANDLGGSDAIANNFSADPLFVNPNVGNFILQNASPAIQAGDPNSAFNNPDGSRNDIGAYGGPNAI